MAATLQCDTDVVAARQAANLVSVGSRVVCKEVNLDCCFPFAKVPVPSPCAATLHVGTVIADWEGTMLVKFDEFIDEVAITTRFLSIAVEVEVPDQLDRFVVINF